MLSLSYSCFKGSSINYVITFGGLGRHGGQPLNILLCTLQIIVLIYAIMIIVIRDGHAPKFSDVHWCESMRISAYVCKYSRIYAHYPHHSAFAATAWPSLIVMSALLIRLLLCCLTRLIIVMHALLTTLLISEFYICSYDGGACSSNHFVKYEIWYVEYRNNDDLKIQNLIYEM